MDARPLPNLHDEAPRDGVHPSIAQAMKENATKRRDREQKRLERNQQIADKAKRQQAPEPRGA